MSFGCIMKVRSKEHASVVCFTMGQDFLSLGTKNKMLYFCLGQTETDVSGPKRVSRPRDSSGTFRPVGNPNIN